jgi:hypothetical protein
LRSVSASCNCRGNYYLPMPRIAFTQRWCSFRITNEDHRALTQIAERREMSTSAVLREMVAILVSTEGKPRHPRKPVRAAPEGFRNGAVNPFLEAARRRKS